MSRLKKLLGVVGLVLVLFTGCSKNENIEGKVEDIFGNALPDVTVKIEKSTFTAKTDDSGLYSLDYAPSSMKLIFSKDGYTTMSLSLDIKQKTHYPAETVTLYPIPKEEGIFYIDIDNKRLIKLEESKIEERGFREDGMMTYRYYVKNLKPLTAIKSGKAMFIHRIAYPTRFTSFKENGLFYTLNDNYLSKNYYYGFIKDTGAKVGTEKLTVRTIELTPGDYAWIQMSESLLQFQKLPKEDGSAFGFKVEDGSTIKKTNILAGSQKEQREVGLDPKSMGKKDSINSNSNPVQKQKNQQQAQLNKPTGNQLTNSERQELEQLRAEKAKAARKKEANNIASATESKPKPVKTGNLTSGEVTSEPVGQSQKSGNSPSLKQDRPKSAEYAVSHSFSSVNNNTNRSETWGKVIFSSDKDAMHNAARVEKVIDLPDESDIKISIISIDTGGSTDVSPTKAIYFTLYKRGEEYSTDASFELGYFFSLESAKKIGNGSYRFMAKSASKSNGMPVMTTFVVDAGDAISALDNVKCNGHMDCSDSTNFKTTIKLLGEHEKQDHEVQAKNTVNTFAQEKTFNKETTTYYAKISKRDHYGKSGQKLKGVGIILQQDRANYHKYHKRDREDTGDNRFDTRGNRNKIKRMLARGSTSQKTLDAIRYGTPLVKVKIYPEYIDVTLESGGGQTQQRQQKKNSAQPRQNKSKKSKCNTDGSIRGISSRGDGFVAVRKGPGTKHRMVGKIYRNGTRVKICDRKGKWKGIIYGDCISGSSRSRNGSCKAGWVYEKYIRIR